MRHKLLAAAALAVILLAGCVQDHDASINGPDPTLRSALPGTGPSLTPVPEPPPRYCTGGPAC
ncbi:MAG: hypothetical protein JWL84_1076 [Rhodospirillales bacterium]|nr:hypothetical protein [Rhodospirillales bacterium]